MKDGQKKDAPAARARETVPLAAQTWRNRFFPDSWWMLREKSVILESSEGVIL
jgi:hypothetical protein